MKLATYADQVLDGEANYQESQVGSPSGEEVGELVCPERHLSKKSKEKGKKQKTKKQNKTRQYKKKWNKKSKSNRT